MLEPWIIGCIINLCGSVVINIGTNLIKYHHTQVNKLLAHRHSIMNPAEQAEANAAMNQKSSYWYTGFLLFFIGNVSNFISMGFTAQSLLAGLGSIQFITNVVCSALIMKHPITARILWATFAIVIGNMLIVFFASHSSKKLVVEELWNLYFQPAYEVYCIIEVVAILILYVYYKETKKRLKSLAAAQGVNPNFHHHKMLPFSYAAISAIIGTQSVLLAKSSSELVRTTISGDNQFIYPFTYFILCAWLLSMVFWLYRMNAALRKFDGVFIIPVLQVVWTLFSIVGGGIYFEEFNDFTGIQIGLFTLGVGIVMFGVYLLAPQTNAGPVGGVRGENSSDLEMQIYAQAQEQELRHALSSQNSSAHSVNSVGSVNSKGSSGSGGASGPNSATGSGGGGGVNGGGVSLHSLRSSPTPPLAFRQLVAARILSGVGKFNITTHSSSNSSNSGGGGSSGSNNSSNGTGRNSSTSFNLNLNLNGSDGFDSPDFAPLGMGMGGNAIRDATDSKYYDHDEVSVDRTAGMSGGGSEIHTSATNGGAGSGSGSGSSSGSSNSTGGSGSSSSGLGFSFKRNKLYPRSPALINSLHHNSSSSDSMSDHKDDRDRMESEDSFTINLSIPGSPMPLLEKKKTRGMNLGFSMPMLDMDIDQ